MKEFILISTARATSSIAMLLSSYLVAKNLSANDAGEFFYSINIVAFFVIVVRLGLDVYVQKDAGASHSSGYDDGVILCLYISSLKLITLSFGVVFLLLNYFGEGWLGEFESLFLFSIFFISLSWVNSGFLKSQCNPAKSAVLDYGGVLMVFCALTVLSEENTLEGLVGSFFISSVIVALVGTSFVIRGLKRKKVQAGVVASDKGLSILLEGSLPVFFSQVFYYIMLWGVVLILEKLSGAVSVSEYNVIFRVSLAVGFFLSVFNALYSNKISVLASKKDIKGLCKLHKQISLRLSVVSIVPVSLVLFFKDDILFYFGEEYAGLGLGLTVLLFAQYINAVTGPVNLVMVIANKGWVVRNSYLLAMLLSISLGILLIPRFGSLGAAVSVSLAVAFQNIGMTLYAFKRIYSK